MKRGCKKIAVAVLSMGMLLGFVSSIPMSSQNNMATKSSNLYASFVGEDCTVIIPDEEVPL